MQPGTPIKKEVMEALVYECNMKDQCADLPLVVGFTQSLEVLVAIGAIGSSQVTIDTGHGDVFAYIVTPNVIVAQDLYDAKLTLKNNNNTFVLEEPMINFSTLYQNGTDIRARGFRMKEQSTFQITIDNSASAVAIEVTVTVLFMERGKKSQGLFQRN